MVNRLYVRTALMGLTVVIACHHHRVQSYMMRGEEPWDLQWWMRVHGRCFELHQVEVYRDCDYLPEYPEAWAHEDRPASDAPAVAPRFSAPRPPPRTDPVSKAFWPGFRWRVLAHKRSAANSRGQRIGESLDLRVNGTSPRGYPGIQQELSGHWEFDELVIDDWFHLEQMDDRVWWMGIGNGEDYWHVNVRIDSKGKASVSVEKQ